MIYHSFWYFCLALIKIISSAFLETTFTNKHVQLMYMAVSNKWYELEFLWKRKKLSELLDLTVTNNEKFLVLWKLLFVVFLLPVSKSVWWRRVQLHECCEKYIKIITIKRKFKWLLVEDWIVQEWKKFILQKLYTSVTSVPKQQGQVHGHKRPHDKLWKCKAYLLFRIWVCCVWCKHAWPSCLYH